MILAEAAFATTVTIHTDDARATLLAMQNPSLTGEGAATIAKMQGNQGVLRKLREWKIPASTETFANALIFDHLEVLCAWELNWRYRQCTHRQWIRTDMSVSRQFKRKSNQLGVCAKNTGRSIK